MRRPASDAEYREVSKSTGSKPKKEADHDRIYHHSYDLDPIGIDLGDRKSHVCVLHADAQIIEES